MRIPQTPPDEGALLSQRCGEIIAANEQAEYNRFCKEANGKYRHWDKVRIIARSRGLDPEIAWPLIRLGRMLNLRQLPFTARDGQALSYA
ncbi:MAG: hypothetical protein ACF8LL_01315, partial [Phycisphaerales bacterium]